MWGFGDLLPAVVLKTKSTFAVFSPTRIRVINKRDVLFYIVSLMALMGGLISSLAPKTTSKSFQFRVMSSI